MIYDFNKQIESIQGEKNEMKLATSLANHLANIPAGNEQESDIFRVIGWGLDLVKSGKIELNEGDVKKLRELITANTVMSRLVKYQLLKVLDNEKG